jgi:hypothetical protein
MGGRQRGRGCWLEAGAAAGKGAVLLIVLRLCLHPADKGHFLNFFP